MNLKEVKIEELPLVGPSYAKKLARLEIENVWDLFHHVPTRFLDFSKKIPINELQLDEIATIHGRVKSFVNAYTKKGKAMQIVTIEDNTGKIDAIWFNQIYLSRTFREGIEVSLAGKLTFMGRKKAFIAPEYEIITTGEQIHTGKLIPVYSETAGISSKWLRRRVFDSYKKYQEEIAEFLPEKTREKYNLINFEKAIHDAHFPENLEDFEKAKNRLAFNELLSLHVKNMKRKKKWEENKIKEMLVIEKEKIHYFIKSLPFELTKSQKKVLDEILKDLQKDIPMNRLLEGDVGSGKTVVATAAAYIVFLNGKKTVFMAPTQILANQHYETLKKLFKDYKIKIGLFTSSKKSYGNFDIFVGTHALLGKNIDLKNVALIVIDEQHKFGVDQRNLLTKKTVTPHILTMTATPIPRTVALTFFGDLDLSVLDELPSGRQKIITWAVPEFKRDGAYQWINDQITNLKSQVFVVCPLIENSETETFKDVKNVNTEFEKLQKVFNKRAIGMLHGKMKNHEKDEVINKFKNGKIDILVTTPVVEVGIDIPNATIMMIEAADRFGLASLHQLRGRVGRGEKKSYCLLMTESIMPKAQQRLMALSKYNSGFELSEIDLALRGPGEIYGSAQSGYPELKIASWNDLDMIRATKTVAEELSDKL